MKRGIDLSKHNKKVDFEKVVKDGYDFAILRAGFGRTDKDETFDYNIENALKNGMQVGVYWFIYASNIERAVINAKKCISVIEKYRYDIDLKVWADWEYDSDKNAGTLTKKQRTDIVVKFLETIEEAGYEVGVYANPDYIKNKFEWNRLSKYPLWLAKYSTSKGDYNPFMWQYSSKGKVNGIQGNVDLNIGYFDGNPYKEPLYTLYRGRPLQSKEYVKWLQFELNEIGYNIEIDGIFGKETEKAFVDFQFLYPETYTTALPDGKCGKKSRTKLKNI